MAPRKYPLNDHAFSVLNPETAYWLGFLMADGCVTTNAAGTTYLKVNLAQVDEDHLHKLSSFLGSPGRPLYHPKDGCVSLVVSSRQLMTDLASHGIVPRKTWSDPLATDQLRHDPSFWLGLLDGDGSLLWHRSRVNARPTPKVQFHGSKTLMQQVAEVVRNHNGNSPSVGSIRSIYRVSVTGKAAQVALRWLYSESPVCLTRKHLKAKELLAWNPQ